MIDSTAPSPPRAVADLLSRTRRAWRLAGLARTACLAGALTLGAAALLIGVDLVDPLSPGSRRVLRTVPPLLGLLAALWGAWRVRSAPTDRQVALWLEESEPALERALSTSLEPMPDGPVVRAFRTRVERMLGEQVVRPPDPRTRRPLAMLGLAAVAAAVAVAAAGGPAALVQRWVAAEHDPVAPGGGSGRGAGVPRRVSTALGALRVRVEPPAYSGLAPWEWDGESALAALPGSRVEVRGEDAGDRRLRAGMIGGTALPVRGAVEWSVARRLVPGDRGLVIETVSGDRVTERVVVPLAMLADQAPVVELTEPSRDLLVATPRGTIRIRGSARDDYGIGAFHLSWIRSRGSGESFTFEEGRWEWAALRKVDGVAHGEHRIELAALGLEPGDVLHLRAVARDRNTVTGPGEGVSPTRVIRIARPDEMAEATTLTGFPIEAEREPVLSQRMIILMTEELLRRAGRIPREELLRESVRIADEQARLRSQVGDQALAPTVGADEPEEHDDHVHDADPILSVNRPLLDAYNAMWSAEGELRIAALRGSLPSQHRALRILQEMRQAERVFARGRQQVQPVDLAAARGTGELDEARPAARAAGPAPDAGGAGRVELEAVLARLPRLAPIAAALALGDVATRLLGEPGSDPEAAALVVRAAESARRGRADEARRLLLRARALLTPSAAVAGEAPRPPAATDPRSAAYFRALGEP